MSWSLLLLVAVTFTQRRLATNDCDRMRIARARQSLSGPSEATGTQQLVTLRLLLRDGIRKAVDPIASSAFLLLPLCNI